jgi:hypothetical protein
MHSSNWAGSSGSSYVECKKEADRLARTDHVVCMVCTMGLWGLSRKFRHILSRVWFMGIVLVEPRMEFAGLA